MSLDTSLQTSLSLDTTLSFNHNIDASASFSTVDFDRPSDDAEYVALEIRDDAQNVVQEKQVSGAEDRNQKPGI